MTGASAVGSFVIHWRMRARTKASVAEALSDISGKRVGSRGQRRHGDPAAGGVAANDIFHRSWLFAYQYIAGICDSTRGCCSLLRLLWTLT